MLTKLEAYFDAAFAAPQGIKRLRELILTLAVQGKLVEQNPADEPACELLKKIAAEKAALEQEGKIKKQKPLPPVREEEKPYALPTGWEWVRLGEISLNIHYGYTASASEVGNARLLRITDIQDSIVNWQTVPFCEISSKNLPSYKLQERDILIARTGGTIGKSYLVDNVIVDSVFASYLIRVIPCEMLNEIFIKDFLETPLYWQQLYAKSMGTGQPNVNGTSLSTLVFPLPPLAEQHRIVAKVDALMARCDSLEAMHKEQEHKRSAARMAVLHGLGSPTAEAEQASSFQDNWQFLQQHFSHLLATKQDVAELRKTILQLAVMGKLVPQNPNDAPASELLKKIVAEKAALEKEGKIKKQKPLPPVMEAEQPYSVPTGWQWVRFGEVGSLERGKSKHRPRNDRRLFENGKFPLVQTGDVSQAKYNNDIILTYTGLYNDFGLKQSQLWEKGTLCITIAANIAESGFLGLEACIPDSIVAFYSLDPAIARYVKNFIEVAKASLEKFAPSTAQKNINLAILNQLPLPLPPLAEQHRIVVKVDALMRLCDAVEAQLEAQTATQTRLLDAVMAAV